eukprot:gene20244-24238_t
MAAVYFLITAEVDKDPFTIFSLRKIKLAEHFAVSTSASTAVPYPLPAKLHTMAPIDLTESESEVPVTEGARVPEVQLKHPVNQSKFILSCLPANPAFCLKLDYHEVMEQFYDYLKKQLPKMYLLDNAHDGEQLRRFLRSSTWAVHLKRDFTGSVHLHNDMLTGTNAVDPALLFGSSIPFHPFPAPSRIPDALRMDTWTLCRLLIQMPAGGASTHSYQFLSAAARMTHLLLGSGAVVPDVLPLVDDASKWKVIFKPLATTDEVKLMIEQLENVYDASAESVRVTLDGQLLEAHS